ncbi:MAG: hypothetical protein K5761_06185 [Clostridiales bacterium]|nr:hypothetical protein [Clostridiales bacterium]
MKSKEKIAKINPLAGMYASLIIMLITVPVRIYQLLNIVEADSGFYKVIDRSVYIMYILSAIAVILSFILTKLAKNVPASKSPFRRNRFLAVTSIIFAVGIILDVVDALSTFLIQAKSFSNVGLTIFGTLDQGQVPMLLESIFGVFAAIYILVFGISYIDGRTTYSQYKFLALTPLFWAMTRLVERFVRKISYVNVSDLMLELFGITFMIIALLAFARICSGISNVKSMRTLFYAGFIAMFLLGTANLARFVMLISGNFSGIPKEYPLSLADLSFGVFIVAYAVNAIKCAKENDTLEEYEEKSEKDKEDNMQTDDNFLGE